MEQENIINNPNSSWLNEEFFKTLVSVEEPSRSIIIVRNTIEPAVPDGENYASTMHRVMIEFKEDNDLKPKICKFIIKSPPIGAAPKLVKFIVEKGVFERELQIYRIFPAMYSVIKDKFQDTSSRLPWARSFYCSRKDTLVMKDLNALGYNMMDRRRGLDLNHCIIALKSLAIFHATSVALYSREPGYFDNFQEILYVEENREMLEHFSKPTLLAQVRVIAKYSNYKRFEENLSDLAAMVVDFVINTIKPRPGSFCVFNHGDFWINNMMFRHNPLTGEADDVKFIDFQGCRFTSPAMDLLYFFHTSCSEDVRYSHMDKLLAHYHSVLSTTLVELGCNPTVIPLGKLRREVNDKAIFGLYSACTMLSALLVEPENLESTKSVTISEETDERESAYSNPIYREALEKILLHFENKGLF